MTRIRELPRLVVMASGRGSNLEAILDAIDRGELRARVVAVISDRSDAQALERAARRQIEALALDYRAFPDRDAYHEALLEHLVRIAPDLIVLAGYMRLLPGRIVARFPQRIVNIHPSLLPAFPGLNPHRQALDYGVKVSGCTVHFVDEGMDTGPIIMQAAVPVLEDDTEKSLAERILRREHELYPRAIAAVLDGRVRVEGRRVRIFAPGAAGDHEQDEQKEGDSRCKSGEP